MKAKSLLFKKKKKYLKLAVVMSIYYVLYSIVYLL